MKVIPIVIIILLMYSLSMAKSDIKDIKEKINKEKQVINSINNEKRSVISQLNEIDRRLFKSRQELNSIKSELYKKRNNIKNIEKEIEEIKESILKEKEYINKTVVSLYKLNNVKYVKLFFSSTSYNNLFKRVKYINAIIENDRRIIDNLRENMEFLNKKKDDLDSERKKLSILKNRAIEEKSRVDFEKKEKLALLKFIDKEKSAREKLLKELEEAAKNLESTITNSTKEEFKPKEDFGRYKGRLDPPLNGKIISLFGKVKDPKFNTYIYNNGIEIKIPLESEVRAVFDGKVVYSGWLKGYGEIIIISHGNHYYTLYAHISKLFKEVGVIVNKGEVIALSGDSGSLKGPSLYFEIRNRGIPDDPLDWLAIPKQNIGRRK